MFNPKNRPWMRRMACGLAYVVAMGPVSAVMAADADEAPPVPPPPPPGVAIPAPAPTTNPGIPSPGTAPAVSPTMTPGNGETPFTGETRNVLLFPLTVDDTAGTVPREVVDSIPARIAAALNRSKTMDAAVFYRNAPLVVRALRENRLRPAITGSVLPDVIPEIAVPLLAREYRANTVLEGSVSGYTFDKQNNTAEVSLTLDMRDMGAGGKSRLIAVTGKSKPAPVVSSELALATEAANDVAMQAAAEIAGTTVDAIANPPAPAPVKPVRAQKKRNTNFAILAGAILLIAALAASNGGGHSSSSNNNGGTGGTDTGSTPPPVPNL
jgi:hypothetical protein